jgi:hypothetical protein
VFGLLLTNAQELIVLLPSLVLASLLTDARLGRDMIFITSPLVVIGTTTVGFNAIWTVFLTTLEFPFEEPLIAVLLAVCALFVRIGQVGSEWSGAFLCGLCFLLGLGFYLYLPVASMTTPPVNWGYARTVEGFLHVISREQYCRVHPTHELNRYVQQLWELIIMTGRQFGWFYLVLAVLPVGFMIGLPNHFRRLFARLAAIWIGVTLLLLFEINPTPDRRAWEHVGPNFAASQAILAVWLGFGLMIVAARIATPRRIELSATRSP